MMGGRLNRPNQEEFKRGNSIIADLVHDWMIRKAKIQGILIALLGVDRWLYPSEKEDRGKKITVRKVKG